MTRMILVMALAACGAVVEQEPPSCSAATCAGCCSSSGECRACSVTPTSARDAGLGIDVALVDAGSDAGVRPDGGPGDAGATDAGVLEVDAGKPCGSLIRLPPNQATDGELECAAVSAFRSLGGSGRVELIPGRSGAGLRFTTASGLFNNEFTSTWTFRVTRAGRHCASAFVRGSATAITMRLYLGPTGTAAGEQFDLPGPLTSWTRVPPTVRVVSAMGQPGDVGFLVFVDKNHLPGATIEVDDLDVWRSEDGTCGER